MGTGDLICKCVEQMIILGVAIDNSGSTSIAADYRLAKATRHFWMYSDQLVKKTLPLRQRFDIYARVVQKSALWCAGGWVWSRTLVTKLQTWENTQLRRILGAARRPDENFVQHQQRATRLARKLFLSYGNKSLPTLVAESVCLLAGFAFRPGRTLASQCLLGCALQWRNRLWWQAYRFVSMSGGSDDWRHPASNYSPKRNWEDIFHEVYGDSWMSQMSCGRPSPLRLAAFRNCAFISLGLAAPDADSTDPKEVVVSRKPRNVTIPEVPPWGCVLDAPRAEIVGDSLLVVSWCQGYWQLKEQQYEGMLQECIESMTQLQSLCLCAPRCLTSWWIRHVPRELNAQADALAKACLESGQPHLWVLSDMASLHVRAVSVHFDGGHKGGRGSSAWTMSVALDSSLTWQVVAEAAVYHAAGATSVSAEMYACFQSVRALKALLHNRLIINTDGTVANV
jgi:ribonuclease HI